MNSDIIYIFRWGDRQEYSEREIKRERERRGQNKEKKMIKGEQQKGEDQNLQLALFCCRARIEKK